MSYAIQHVAFVVSNLFQQQHSKVITPTKHLKSTIESTAKAASLFIYYNAISATFNTLVNQKYHSTLGSINTETMSEVTTQYQLANISTGTIMTLTITEKSLYYRATKKHSLDIN